MAAVYFAALRQAPQKKAALFSTRPLATRVIRGFRFRSPNLISRAAVCSAATPPGFDVIEEHTGVGHNRNIVMPFGGESPGSEGPES
ncbi:hypothetical protein M5K25_014532 [Dendrobium thyrsiflorum]|uniref:Uncharacterized protein n=1 Tax=Dendrobium thyrsiflorum TaxID=117978 RepID=A0ABD0V334_DENTH